MTLPAATFTPVTPPPDGLALAFTSARRRRNSKAAVSAFGGAVAIASVLSFLAPPGQSLVQEPAQPAHGDLLPGLPGAPQHTAPAPVVRTPATSPRIVDVSTTSTRLLRPLASDPVRTSSVVHQSCDRTRIACVVVKAPAAGAPTLRASVCPAAASVTVEYDAPHVGSRRTSSSTVQVGSCPS
jgi:hypothetical protein